MDILQNSIRAGAAHIRLDIAEETGSHALIVAVTDDGAGMDETQAQFAADAFYTTRTTRRVGLGLPLLKQNAERTGGHFSLRSTPGVGTRVEAGFVTNHPDRLVLGDVPGVVLLTAGSNPAVTIDYRHELDGRSYCFSSDEVRQALPGIPVSEPVVYHYLKEMISENLGKIGVSLRS